MANLSEKPTVTEQLAIWREIETLKAALNVATEALNAERERALLDCIVHPEGESPYTGMTEDEYRAVRNQPKPMTGEWTVRPVHKNDGTVWPGIGYISDGKRTYGSANFEEGKAIVAAINAALAAEREKYLSESRSWFDRDKMLREQLAAAQIAIQARNEQDYTAAINEALAAERSKVRPAIFDPEHYPEDRITQLEQQLAAERDWIAKFCGYDEKGALDAYVAKQLAAEREKREHIERELGCAFDRMVADYQRQLAAERSKAELAEWQWKEACKKVKALQDALTTVAQWDDYAKDALAKLKL